MKYVKTWNTWNIRNMKYEITARSDNLYNYITYHSFGHNLISITYFILTCSYTDPLSLPEEDKLS